MQNFMVKTVLICEKTYFIYIFLEFQLHVFTLKNKILATIQTQTKNSETLHTANHAAGPLAKGSNYLIISSNVNFEAFFLKILLAVALYWFHIFIY